MFPSHDLGGRKAAWLAADHTFESRNEIDQMTVPTPTTDLQLANKDYVDNAITNFNNDPNIGFVEFTADGTLTAAQMSGFKTMLVCMVGSGSHGKVSYNSFTQDNKIYYGNSGPFIAFHSPTIDGDITVSVGQPNDGLSTTEETKIEFATLPNGPQASFAKSYILPGTPNNINQTTLPPLADNPRSSGVFNAWQLTSYPNVQYGPCIRTPAAANSGNVGYHVPPPFCMNGYGAGGSYLATVSPVNTPPTGGYVCFVLYK